MTNLVVSGYYGSKNAGDEAMLAAMLEVFSDIDPQLHITVISSNPEETRRRHGVDSVSWLDFFGILRALRGARLLISGGGSLLQNVTSRRSLYYYLSIIFLAYLSGCRVMLYAQGIGPIWGCMARNLMRWIGNHADLITVRDQGSLEELSSLGITRPHIECTADPVMAINPVGKEAGRAILHRYGVEGVDPTIGISVREWQHLHHYKKVLAETADALARELGAKVVFLPMQYPEDVKVAEEIAAIAEEPCTILRDEYSTGEMLSLVGTMDLMVGIRLHALIFAGVMGVPMLGISYDPKIDRFLNSIGESPVGDLSSITAEHLMAAIRERWENRQEFCERNAKLRAGLRRKAARNAEMAVDLMRR